LLESLLQETIIELSNCDNMADTPLNRGGGTLSESPLLSGTRTKSRGSMVKPQPVTEKSLMESVAGFINEVQAFNHPSTDPKSQVTWARFEQADINDPIFFNDYSNPGEPNSPPLLLVLGYSQGVQVWLIPGSGDASLVLSWFHGQVKILRVLPTPELSYGSIDPFKQSRPLVALCDSAGPGPAFMSASFVSLKTGEQVNNIKFSSEVADICVNKRVVCVAFREKVAIFDTIALKNKMTISSCYPSPGVHTNPLALHDRWLAYADKALCVTRKSAGGMDGEATQSVTAWGINVGSKLASGVTKVVTNIFAGSPRAAPVNPTNLQTTNTSSNADGGSGETGVVTILDMVDLNSSSENDMEECHNIDISNPKVQGVVAHFVAHTKAIVALQWDPSGSLLLTADKPGHNFHLYRVVSNPLGSSFAAIHHVYTLYRGDTPGSVQDITFSSDTRWVTVSTLRGTTHIFPICPYGGPVGVRTHTSHRVVNKLSRFHRSAGLNETPGYPSNSSGRNSPNPTMGSSPGLNKGFDFPPGMTSLQPLAYPSPHFPPFPTPTLIQPLAQLKQPYIVSLTSGVALSGSRKPGHGKRNSVPDEIPIRLAVTFGTSRARMMQSVHSAFSKPVKRPVDSLFVMANHGQLLEYSLDPVPDQTIAKDKVCESSPIELNVTAFGQWDLSKQGGKERPDVSPPLDQSNPLLIMRDQLEISESTWPVVENEDQWLSQVEIVSHVGPARRLWMGPQFSFRTFQDGIDREDDLADMDVTVTCRPQQSEPMQMPGGSPTQRDKRPVFIECGSANSFELSPRFANLTIRNSRESVDLEMDVESELKEAMSDIVSKRNTAGDQEKKLLGKSADAEEEFFCLSTEDVRSTPAICEGPRTRHSSGLSQSRSRHTSTSLSGNRPVEMITAETKIFSVAVQPGKSGDTDIRNLVLKDIENQMMDRPVVLSKKSNEEKILNSEDEFKPAVRDASEHIPGFVESSNMVGELESAISQETVPEEDISTRKSKKNKKKNKSEQQEQPMVSSADEIKEVEVKPKKKKTKCKDKEEKLIVVDKETEKLSTSKGENLTNANKGQVYSEGNQLLDLQTNTKTSYPEHEESDVKKSNKTLTLDNLVITKQPSYSDPIKDETPQDIFKEFTENNDTLKSSIAPDQDLVEFSEEEGAKIVEADDNDDSEKVDFFIREKSSSAELDEEMETSSSKIDPLGAKPNPWFNEILKKGSSIIEDQIFGAVRKYEQTEERDSDEEKMLETENQREGDEKTSPTLLEEEDIPKKKNVVEKLSSSLSQLLKGDAKKESHQQQINDDTSDDDFMFRPVPNKRNKKKQKNKQIESDEEFYGCKDGSVADSESEKVPEADKPDTSMKSSYNKDGWSFEVDEKEIDKLLETQESPEAPVPEERTALEDVFRFDSELQAEDSKVTDVDMDKKKCERSVSVEDLNDALMDETDDSEAEGRPANITSSSYAGTSYESASESSNTNSPNPRNTQTGKSKNKKGKKKKK